MTVVIFLSTFVERLSATLGFLRSLQVLTHNEQWLNLAYSLDSLDWLVLVDMAC